MLLGKRQILNAGRLKRGLTLIEITVVITVLMILVGMSMYAVGGYKEWKLGSEAAVELRRVYNAQRTYLAENPTETVATLTAAKVIPYLSDGAAALPTVEDMDGNNLNIKVDVSPPVIENTDGSTYDPSGKFDDGIWDVGGG
ncbi:MAG: type II secretion system protein [Akkermansiaceae bacterium]